MVKRIKYLLYKKGYLNLGPTKNKIDFLLCSPNLKVIHNAYDGRYIKTLDSNIIKHQKVINMFLELNISGDKLDYKVDIKNITLSEWFSNNGYILNSEDKDIYKWLIGAKKIIIKTESMVNNIKSGNEYHNFQLLKNLYSDVTNIVEILYEIYKA